MVVVIKIGDRAMISAFSGPALADLQTVFQTTQVLIVHGGGDTVTRIAERLDIPQEFIVSPEGIKSRLTDEKTIDVYTMVMGGKINKKIVRDLQKSGLPAVGLSGLDGGMIRATRKERIIAREPNGKRRVVEGGYTGHITEVKQNLVQAIMSENYLPVIAPIALGTRYEPLNVDGDRAAAQIAGALQADVLVLITDVDSVMLDSLPVEKWSAAEAKRHLPSIGQGMNTKVQAAIEAISMGVKRVSIAPSKGCSPYSKAVSGKSGTMITP